MERPKRKDRTADENMRRIPSILKPETGDAARNPARMGIRMSMK